MGCSEFHAVFFGFFPERHRSSYRGSRALATRLETFSPRAYISKLSDVFVPQKKTHINGDKRFLLYKSLPFYHVYDYRDLAPIN